MILIEEKCGKKKEFKMIYNNIQLEENDYKNPPCCQCGEELRYRIYEGTFDSHELFEHLTCINKECNLYMEIQENYE